MNNHPDTTAPPHNINAEENIIGAVLLDGEWLDYISLSTDQFYIHRHRFIWGAFLAVKSSGLAVDYITTCAELERRGQLAEIGGDTALYDLMNRAEGIENAESHAEIIRNTAAARTYLDLAGTIAMQAVNGGVDEAAAIEVLTSQSKGKRDGRHISDGLVDLSEAIQERTKNPVDVWGIPTGFIDLDKKTGGMHKEQVFILSGESGTGKTTLMFQSALAAATAGYGVAIFEKEMSEPRTLRRFIEIDSGVPNRAMLSGRMNGHEAPFIHSMEKLSSLPIYINDDPVGTTADIRGVIARARVKMPIDIVYLDYLSLLDDRAPGNSQDYDQTKAVRFRQMCREMGLAGFAIQDMVKSEGAPTMRTMSGGAKVRFGADVIFFIVQDVTDPNVYFLISAKERDGDTGKKPIALRRPGLAFQDATMQSMDLSAIS